MKIIFKAMAFSMLLVIGATALPISISPVSHVQAAEWYEGGTLHQASALEWQEATQANKLATAGDFVATAFKNELFIPEIQSSLTSTEHMKFLAQKLVEQLDDAFAADPDPELNRKLFANQQVGSSSAMIMAMSGWVK